MASLTITRPPTTGRSALPTGRLASTAPPSAEQGLLAEYARRTLLSDLGQRAREMEQQLLDTPHWAQLERQERRRNPRNRWLKRLFVITFEDGDEWPEDEPFVVGFETAPTREELLDALAPTFAGERVLLFDVDCGQFIALEGAEARR